MIAIIVNQRSQSGSAFFGLVKTFHPSILSQKNAFVSLRDGKGIVLAGDIFV
jgi:hypothetical protein